MSAEAGKAAPAVTRNCYVGRGDIAVLTSGGDSQGMNSALRSVVRMGMYVGLKVYFVREGYQGLCDGGDENYVEAHWFDVSDIIHKGGTVIGSARCKDFRDKPGRVKAALNMIERNIRNLVVIGGDGSLTGANIFKSEWSEHVATLLKDGKINEEKANACACLNIVGLVGSIDNDFCGTDMTIGTDSALHRIIEATDAISYTADSHQRAFVLEVMGRNCGYLALISGIIAEADYIFVPENPPPRDWKERLKYKMERGRKAGIRMNIIVVAEGAIDADGKSISANEVRSWLADDLGLDARLTVLGHVQRGGRPSVYDRLLGSRQGGEAVVALMDYQPQDPAVVIAIRGNRIVRIPMMQAVERTKSVKAAMDSCDFKAAVERRGDSFARNFQIYQELSQSDPAGKGVEVQSGNYLVIHVGAPACGMNAATRCFVRMMATRGHEVVAAVSSFKGFSEGKTSLLHWTSVKGWNRQGGSKIGTKRHLPSDVGLSVIAKRLEEYNIMGMLIVGGFEAFQSGAELQAARDEFPQFRIPIIVIPATISNNVPGCDFSIGSDTALNEIVASCDKLKLSAQGTKRRVFVVETMGGYCGYLATISGLAAGADTAYINEDPFNVCTLLDDFAHLKQKMEARVQRGLVMRNEYANDNYSTDFIYHLYSEEAKESFQVRKQVLGYIQQGSTPSPFDRNLATKFGVRAAHFLLEKVAINAESGEVCCDEPATILGVRGSKIVASAITDLLPESDLTKRRWKTQWFMGLRPLLALFANKETNYIVEGREEATATT